MKNFSIDFDDVSSKMLLHDALRGLKGIYNIKLERPSNKRSNEQNKYFHGVILPYIANEVGELEIEMKEILKSMFLSTHEVKFNKGITRIKNTSDLSTIEFEEFNEKCRIWAYSFFELTIPLPNQIID